MKFYHTVTCLLKTFAQVAWKNGVSERVALHYDCPLEASSLKLLSRCSLLSTREYNDGATPLYSLHAQAGKREEKRWCFSTLSR